MKRRFSELLGWYGFTALLGSYAASSLGFLALDSTLYLVLNLTGAVSLLLDAWPDRNWQIIVLNAVWAIIAFAVILP